MAITELKIQFPLVIKHLVKLCFPLTVAVTLSLSPLKAQAALVVGGFFNNNSILRYDETTGNLIDVFVPSGTGGLVIPASITEVLIIIFM